MTTILLLISIILSFTFTVYILCKERQIPESISAMVFSLKKPWLWSIWLWIVAITLAPALIIAMPLSLQILAFLTIGCLVFTGALPILKEDNAKWHNILGVSAGIFSQICVCFICPWMLFAWLLMVVYIGYSILGLKNKENNYSRILVFIAEEICKITVYSSLLICLL